MSRLSGASQRPLRLVQPYDEDTRETASTAPLAEKSLQPSLPRQFGGYSPSPIEHLASLHAPAAASGGKWKTEGPPPNVVQGESKSTSFSSLPSFQSSGQRKTAPGESSSIPSAHAYYGAMDLASILTRLSSLPAPKPASSVDRLAALYQQYRTPAEVKQERPTDKYTSQRAHEERAPIPPPALPVAPTRPMAATGRHAGSSHEGQDYGAGTLPSSACSSQAEEESEQTEVRQQGPFRTAPSPRLAVPGAPPSSAHNVPVGAADVSTRPAARQSRQRQRRSTVTLPAALSESGPSAMMNTAIFVWAPLGFFEMRPSEDEAHSNGNSESEAVAATRKAPAVGSSTLHEPSDPRDVEAFLFALEEYLSFFCSENTMGSSDALATYATFMRNGLWRVLFNAVFYCVTVLDERRRRCGLLSEKDREVRTGGPEDSYEVVFPSSSSADVSDERSVEREAPVRLTWHVPGESAEERAARCVRDPLPSESPLWAGGMPYRSPAKKEGKEEGDRDDDARYLRGEGIGSGRCTPPLDLYGGRLRTPPPVSDWYFTLRCLAQVGYRRDAFYLQTPFSASPLELLLALLWLTQQYKLLAVAEYVEINRRFGFLLQYHLEAAFWRGSVKGAAGVPSTASPPLYPQTRERLLFHFSNASVWPPISFDENSAIQLRLLQLERCLGRSSMHESPAASATVQVRRLMAVHRLISLSLNRLHNALQRQAEQTVLLGLHSPLDAQLCRKEHHDLYEEVMAGLTYVQGTEHRLQAAAQGLAKAGSLVAFLLRYEESGVTAEEVLLALEEDDATWLAKEDYKSEDEEDAKRNLSQPQSSTKTLKRATAAAARWQRAVRRGTLPSSASYSFSTTSAAALAQSLSAFRATQSRASLTEMWKRMLRRSHVAPQTIQPENLCFLLDVDAQQIQEARVLENMKSRYSLQAALAAELAVLGYERQQRHQRSVYRSPLRRGGKLIEESVNSRCTADAETNAEVRPVRVTLPAMELVTNTATTFAQLQAEEEAYGPVTLSTAEMQLTEVGEPAAGSTTSARLELERLQTWETELDAQLGVEAQTEARVAHCKKVLESLYHQFGLRIATPIVPRKAL